MTTAVPRRPVLRYHGGKWMLAPWVISHFPPHKVYVEPFGGGAAVLLRKERSFAEVYNDLDGEIVNLFRVLRNESQAEQLRRAAYLTPFSRDELNAADAMSADPVECARRAIVRSLQGWGNSGFHRASATFRANGRGHGRVPSMDWTNWPEQVPAFTERLRGVAIENRDALEVIAQHDAADTLYYVDPPYVHSTRAAGSDGDRHVYAHEMTDDQHRELAKTLRAVSGMVVLSGYPCDLYDQDLYPDWRRVARAALADGAKARTEVLWLNPAAAARTVAQMQWDNVAEPTQGGDGVGG